MDFSQYRSIVLIGFVVWLIIAPRIGKPNYGEMFLAYMVTLLICLVGTSEIIAVKPAAFYFTVGGVFAFFYTLARLSVRIKINNKE